jgi:hypothetical protein
LPQSVKSKGIIRQTTSSGFKAEYSYESSEDSAEIRSYIEYVFGGEGKVDVIESKTKQP